MTAAIVWPMYGSNLVLLNCFRNQEKMFKTSVKARPHCPLTRTNIRMKCHELHNSQKLDPCRRFAPLTVWVSLLVFTSQLFVESRTVGASQTDAKQNLTQNSHSWSLKVTHF